MKHVENGPNGSPTPVAPVTVFGPSIEDNVVGTWFARLGVLALLIGAAFGYRYAVDQGLIGPAARVTLGICSGAALIGWGHWARSKGWFNFAHAISGGGVAIVYLSILAAQYRFELISPAVALTLLSGVAVLSVWLALAYDSLPLAILATLGAFFNPVFISADDPIAALTYVVGVDLGVVSIAFFKRWTSLTKLALAGTVAVVMLVAEDAGTVEGIGFTTVLWVLFSLVPVIQGLRDDRKLGYTDIGIEVSVAFLYLSSGFFFLPGRPMAQGVFALVTGGGYMAMCALAFSNPKTRGSLAPLLGALGLGCVTLAPPLMLDGPTVHLMWSIEGAILLYAGSLIGHIWARAAAAALIGVGLLGTIEAISTYEPARLLTTPTSLVIALEILVLYAVAYAATRAGEDEEWRTPVVQGALVVANLMTLAWLSQEVKFEIGRQVEMASVHQSRQFALSGLWGVYSAGLIAVGVASRQRWARYLGLATFGITVVKMVTVDLWQLEVLQRTFAFGGLGVLMIACSFLYNRFRSVIVGDRD
ncbi:MAG: DUF2339 domain-containing protein [Actinomycetota bacterium]